MFIQLTDIGIKIAQVGKTGTTRPMMNPHDPCTNKPVLIAVDKITYIGCIRSYDDGVITYINLDNDNGFYVKEPLEEVVDMINRLGLIAKVPVTTAIPTPKYQTTDIHSPVLEGL